MASGYTDSAMSEAEELAKSGTLILGKFADLFDRLAGPMAEEIGMMLGDKVRVYRVKNWIKTVEKTERLLREARLCPNAVPPRLFLRIMEASSIEDNETLQDMWAGLLATASQDTDEISPSFVETLKQLTPDEARYLKRVREMFLAEYRRDDLVPMELPGYKAFEKRGMSVRDVPWGTFERLGLMHREYEVHAMHSTDGDRRPIIETEMGYWFVFTEHGVRFLTACEGPSLADSGSGRTTSKCGD
jgi:hypothetical protein